MEGLKGFSASVSPPSLNSLHFSPREAVEKNYSHCSPLPEMEIPLVALDPAVEGLALNYPPVEGQTLHWRPSDRSLIVPVRSLWQEPDATCLGHVTPEDKKKALPG